MKTITGKSFKHLAVLLFMAIFITVLGACTAIQIGGELILKTDGSGSRKFVLYLFDSDNGDGYGNAFKYSRLHGDALKKKVEEVLKARLSDSSWITVSVSSGTQMNINNGKQCPVEYITLAFSFKNFDDYTDKMTLLGYFGKKDLPADSKFTVPIFQTVRKNVYRYRENADATMWTLKPLFLAMMEDPEVLDFSAQGANTKATHDELLFYGIEMKGVNITLTLGTNPPKPIISGTNINELF